MGTVPLGQSRDLHLFREGGRGLEEVGGGRRKGRQKYPEREGVGPQFTPQGIINVLPFKNVSTSWDG